METTVSSGKEKGSDQDQPYSNRVSESWLEIPITCIGKLDVTLVCVQTVEETGIISHTYHWLHITTIRIRIR